MDLSRLLGVRPGVTALIGGGGKTTHKIISEGEHSMNYTKNYRLPQWVKEDRIMMDDFTPVIPKYRLYGLRSLPPAVPCIPEMMRNEGRKPRLMACSVCPSGSRRTGS